MFPTPSFLIFLCLVNPAGQDKPPSKQELAAISKRGRSLAAYDFAAWHGSDAAQAKNLKPGLIERYIARETDQGWVVAFG